MFLVLNTLETQYQLQAELFLIIHATRCSGNLLLIGEKM